MGLLSHHPQGRGARIRASSRLRRSPHGRDIAAAVAGRAPAIAPACVTVPLFAKVHAKGDGVAPVFAAVSEKGAPKWNFYKYLVGKDGKVIAGFSSRTKPDDADLVQAIEQALAAKS